MGFLGKELSLIPSESTVRMPPHSLYLQKNVSPKEATFNIESYHNEDKKRCVSKTPMKEIQQEPNKWRDIP